MVTRPAAGERVASVTHKLAGAVAIVSTRCLLGDRRPDSQHVQCRGLCRDGRHRASFMSDGPRGDITCRIGCAQGEVCIWQSPRAGRGGEPQRVDVFENHPEILCKMAATWRCLAVDCGLDRRCHERRHRGNPLTFDCRDRELWLVFRRHQLLPGAPMNPWRSIDGCTGQCWP